MRAVAMIKPEYWSNVYSILRTADGLGLDSVYIVDYERKLDKRIKQKLYSGKEPWNKLQFVSMDFFIKEVLSKYNPVALELVDGAIPIDSYTWKENSIVILGPENGNVPDDILSISDCVVIPMSGKTRCMNVACAGSIGIWSMVSSLNNNVTGGNIINE